MENVFGKKIPELPFEKTPVIGGRVREIASEIDLAVGEDGVSKGMRNVLEANGAAITVHFDDHRTLDYIRKAGQPLILAFTHDSPAQPFVVLSALSCDIDTPRDDIRILVADGLPQYPHLNSYLIPLYNTAPKGRFRPDRTVFKSLGGRAMDINPIKAALLNDRNLRTASKEFRNGKLIAITPDGNIGSKNVSWSRGIGRLITYAGEGSNGYIVFADTAGAGRMEFAKLLNPLLRPKPFQHVLVRFSRPLSIDGVIVENGSDIAAITANLNRRYNAWI